MSADIEQILNTRYAEQCFINNPESHPDAQPLRVLHVSQKADTVPQQSIVMPIHNQEAVIEYHLQLLYANTTTYMYELILILDSCSDDTVLRIFQFLHAIPCPENLVRTVVIESISPLFETAADNVGCLIAQAPYILEIQADIQLLEKGYNVRLQAPFRELPNLLAVSGRCCHGLTHSQGIGKCMDTVEHPLSEHIPHNGIFITETCNRGPLLLDAAKLRELGYLDERHFFLDNSDHDLMIRGFVQKNWICGYVPIEIISKLSDGSTRKPRDSCNQKIYDFLKQRSVQNSFLSRYLSLQPKPRLIQFIPVSE